MNRWFLLGTALLLCLLGWFFWPKASAEPETKDAAPATAESSDAPNNQKNDLKSAFSSLDQAFGQEETPIPVTVGEVQQGRFVIRITAQGVAHTYEQLEVISEVSGMLKQLHVQEGQKVNKGDLLAEIDRQTYQLAFEEAHASYLSALADYLVYEQSEQSLEEAEETLQAKREALRLRLSQGDLSKEAFDQSLFITDLSTIKSGNRRTEIVAARTLEQSRVRRDQALLNLEKCQVRAPFDGVVFDLKVTVGKFIGTNASLFQLVNLENTVVKINILESEIGDIAPGRAAVVQFSALRDLGWLEGTVTALAPTVNAQDKTIEAIITLKSRNPRIRPGMFAEAKLESRVIEDTLFVPKAAILPRDDRFVVFVVSPENKAKWEYVQIGLENEEYIQITESRLNSGDRVLTDNHFTMGHDTLVEIRQTSQP
jgi:RND family efflux transporter MFP subunit